MYLRERTPAIIGTAAVLSWVLWLLILFFIAPNEIGIVSIILFLITLWLACSFTFILLFFFLRLRLLKLGPAFKQFHIILRESFFLSTWLIIILLMKKFGILTLFNFLLSFILFFLIEFFLLSIYEQRNYPKIKTD